MVISQTTLGELYTSLSPEEIKGLHLYLQKNTMGKNNTILALHKFICQAKQAKQLDQLETEDIKSELFGGDSKSVSKLTTYNNLLTNHIKDYLLLSKIHEKNIYTETLWGEILIERGLKRNLLLKLTNFRYDLYKDSYALMKKFFHDRELFFYEHLKFSKKNLTQLIMRQKEQLKSFELFFSYYKLELLNSIVAFNEIRNSGELDLSKEAILFSEQHLKSNNELLKTKALLLKLYLFKDLESYNLLLNILYDSHHLFSVEQFVQMVTALSNFCQHRLAAGNEAFDKENYNLLKFLYENEYLFKYGIYTLLRLITFIRLELRYGTIEKAEQLLEESLKVIAPSQKDSFQYLIESRVAFAKQDYMLSLRKISIINPADSIYYYPQYKIMLIKCYIMLADIDRLNAEQENFYKYLNAHKNIQDDEKRRHKLFIKYAEYLTEARYEYLTGYMKKRIENALLQTSPYFTEKQWVRERWEELKSVGSGQ